jgi:hypothetical protein
MKAEAFFIFLLESLRSDKHNWLYVRVGRFVPQSRCRGTLSCNCDGWILGKRKTGLAFLKELCASAKQMPAEVTGQI